MRKYHSSHIFFHWLVALLLLAALAMGAYMTGLAFSPQKLRLYSWHKWLGVSIFLLVLVRLALRGLYRAPRFPDSMGRVEKWMAAAMHISLYFLMMCAPLSGYFYSLAAGVPVVYFGVIELPVFYGPQADLKVPLKWLHETLTYSLLFLIAVHFIAAMKHQFLDKDKILSRILPGKY